MRSAAARSNTLDTLVAALDRGTLDEAAAQQLYQLGPHAVILALLAAAGRIAEQNARISKLQSQTAAGDSLGAPSGMRAVYTTPNVAAELTAAGHRRKRYWARDGHLGHRRPTRSRIDERRTHRLPTCPCFGGSLQRCQRSRTRIIEDLPEDLRAQVIENTIPCDYCPRCKKHVEPVVPDALPNATFGHRLISFTKCLVLHPQLKNRYGDLENAVLDGRAVSSLTPSSPG